MKEKAPDKQITPAREYEELLSGVVELLESARRQAARAIHSMLTASYWLVGQRLVEHEQKGQSRAEYGAELMERLSRDLQQRLGKGFSRRNLEQMRQFYLGWSKAQTASALSADGAFAGIAQTSSAQLASVPAFPLPWSHYVRLLSVLDSEARNYYEVQAVRGGWSVRQLDRQIATLAYERSAHRRTRTYTSTAGPNAEAEIKDPFVLEFLGLKDEYSESDLEEALIRELEQFLLELGNDFAFVARQKRLRVGTEWYRVDLLFFHRRLRSLIIVELKLGKFSHADAGYGKPDVMKSAA